MRIGIALPQQGTHAQAGAVASFARDAEGIGFDSLWVADRSLAPVEPSHLYPGYSEEKPYPDEFKTFLDPLTVLTVAASATSRVRLGSSTVNAPWYPPLLLARTLTTIDLLSAGRLDVGLGIGWLRDEFTAVNADFSRRGERLEEILDILHGIWTEEVFGHDGPHWTIPRSYVGLRPTRPGGPPVLLGGLSEAALRRVGRRADGWVGIAVGMEPVARLWDTARRAAEEAGRDPGTLRREMRCNPQPGDTAETIAATLHSLREWGAESAFLDLHYRVREPAEALELGSRARELFLAG
ncbi:TIGR03619 family F420-dependent LLM class oxidoreductase [Streptomyces sp. NPDC057638]|uniref:TIGR03619 family F420-dependent LLM class oxidoreductase n=1 Tax=Streptomyces sp. NPDC057638 TaxID=3346190 RepID=UPI0036B0842E